MALPPIAPEVLRITFFQSGGSKLFTPGWVHEKTVPYIILAQSIHGEYETAFSRRSVRVKAPGAFLAPPNTPLCITHHGDRRGRFHARWIHLSCTVFHSIDLADLLTLPRQVAGAAARSLNEIFDALQIPPHSLGDAASRQEKAWQTVRFLCEISRLRPGAAELLAAGELLQPMLSNLRANLTDDITVADMARLAGMSVSRLFAFFQKRLGCSPQSYLKRLRLEAAAALLVSGDAPLKEIAAHTGFANPFHLSREFTRRFGASPKVFRRLNVQTSV